MVTQVVYELTKCINPISSPMDMETHFVNNASIFTRGEINLVEFMQSRDNPLIPPIYSDANICPPLISLIAFLCIADEIRQQVTLKGIQTNTNRFLN